MPEKPTITKLATVARSRIFRLETVDLEFANGEKRQYERIRGNRRAKGSVMIVPMLSDDELLLIREYYVGVDEYVLGFPKGLIDPDEALFSAANRELQEEVGYAANQFETLGRYSAQPGYSADRMAIVLARDLYPARLQGDEPEEIEVVPWRLSQVDQLLEQPDFHESRSVVALLLLERALHAAS